MTWTSPTAPKRGFPIHNYVGKKVRITQPNSETYEGFFQSVAFSWNAIEKKVVVNIELDLADGWYSIEPLDGMKIEVLS